jgi:hypothetical protein
MLCQELKLFSQAAVAVDSSKFKAVNSRDRNFTPGKVDKRKQQIEESIQRYLSALDTADRTLPLLEFGHRYARLQDKLATLRKQMRRMDKMQDRLRSEPDEQLSLTDPDARYRLFHFSISRTSVTMTPTTATRSRSSSSVHSSSLAQYADCQGTFRSMRVRSVGTRLKSSCVMVCPPERA